MKRYASTLLLVFLFMGMGSLKANCGQTVLEPCGLSLIVKGGVAPSHFTRRGYDRFVTPAGIGGFFRVPKLDDLAHLPWQVGGEIDWNASEHVQLFLEGNYQRASGKTLNVFSAPGFNVVEGFKAYKNAGVYLGTRLYPCRICCNFLPFVGFKAGVVYQSDLLCNLFFNGTLVAGSPFEFQKSQWVPSVGGQIGFDYEFFCRWSLVFTAEAVVTQGLRSNHDVVFRDTAQTGGITNAVTGDTGKVISFPVTLGLRYKF